MKKRILIFAFILISGIANAQARLKWYRDYQASVEWNHWIDSQPKKRIEAVKAAVKQSKDIQSKNNQKSRLNKKEDRIRQRIKS
jgi:hypothetical protein